MVNNTLSSEIVLNPEDWNFVIDHVFYPLRLPQEEDKNVPYKEYLLAAIVADAAELYAARLSMADQARWPSIAKLVRCIAASHQTEILSPEHIVSLLAKMARDGELL